MSVSVSRRAATVLAASKTGGRRRGLLATTALSAVVSLALVPDGAMAQDAVYNSGTTTIDADRTIAGNLVVSETASAAVVISAGAEVGVQGVSVGRLSGSDGMLIIEDDARLSSTGDTYVAVTAGSKGAVTVRGAGSQWESSNGMYVGYAGGGTLRVAEGGRVANTRAYLGNGPDSVGSATVTGKGSFWGNSQELVLGNYMGEGTLLIADGGEVTNTEGYIGYQTGSTGSATVTGADSLWASSSTLLVGNAGFGTLLIADGGHVTNGTGVIGGDHVGAGAATVTGAGSAWANSGSLYVGGAGSGALWIAEGGEVTNEDGRIGGDSGSTGSATVTGMGSSWFNRGELAVGYTGSGTMEVTAGGEVRSTSSYIGWASSAVGAAGVRGADSLWANDGELFIGMGGSGTLEIADGGEVTNTEGHIGYQPGSRGSATVTGAGSLWASSSTLLVGDAGFGTLLIADGGRVTNGTGVIGGDTVGNGAAAVVGAGSLWVNSSDLVVGLYGDGLLEIVDGGRVTNSYGAIGSLGTGAAKVTGAGSVWANSSTLRVGVSGSGTLWIADGGEVTSQDGIIGNNPKAVGSATVTGAGSVWANSGALRIGSFGSGTTDITEGGTVRVGAGAGIVHLAEYEGSTGVLNIGAAAGETAVAAGVLEASEVRFGEGAGTLNFNLLGVTMFEAALTGAGQVNALGGWTELSGDSSAFTGQTTLNGGGVNVTGTLGGDVEVLDGALQGWGAVLGDVVVTSGQLNGWSGTTFGMGSLTLRRDAVVAAMLGDSANAALFDVAGDIVLDGTLNASQTLFGPPVEAGVYRLFDYGGDLTDNGLEIGSAPIGYTVEALAVQTAVAGQVNLAVGGVELRFWDGDAAGSFENGSIDGGDGVWTATSPNWTSVDGLSNGANRPVPSLAVFMGAGGTVTLDAEDGALSATGLQFAADDYVLTGAALTLVEETSGAGVSLRVGDGTAAGAGMTATIASNLSGAAGVRKTDLGTLVLTGTNDWTGDTMVSAGTLVIEGANDQGAASYQVGVVSGDKAALIVRDGGTVNAGWLSAANGPGARGEITVTGAGSALATDWFLTVGSAGEGLLTVADGGDVASDGALTFGGVAGGRGEGLVTGAGSRMAASQLFVGSAGAGVLNVLDGGVVESGMPYSSIGADASGHGEMTVSGAGSRWTAAGEVYVGAFGSGTLNVRDGGLFQVDGDVICIGANPGAEGQVTVSGLGSAMTFNQLQIAPDGQGGLRVEAGAVASGVDVYLGVSETGTGDLTVAGNGSRLTLTKGIVVGMGGEGAATLSDGGVLDAAFMQIARNAGSTGVLNIGAAAGETAVGAGTLDTDQVRFGAGTGSLVFNHTGADHGFGAAISGGGGVRQLAGTTRLTGDSSAFTGVTSVEGGVLNVAGTLGGDVSVTGGTLGGSGAILGDVTVADATLSGVAGSTLTMGSLELASGSTVAVALGAASGDGLFDVAGDLTLDGTLDVSDLGGFGAGVYRLFDYGGDLTDNGLELGAAPASVSTSALSVQTATAGKVNLVSTAGADLRFWDGAGPANDGVIQGGIGTWTVDGANWTTADGAVNGAYHPNPGFAVFQGAGGTVNVDGDDLGVTGLQFAVDGYRIEGDGLTLAEDRTVIRVGDGSAAGAGYSATIASVLSGPGGLVKEDLGTLVLTGANTYRGGAFVKAGTLIGNTGSIAGDLVNDARTIFDQGADGAFDGNVSGSGLTVKRGAGGLALTGSNATDWSIEAGSLSAQAGRFEGDVAIGKAGRFILAAAAAQTFGGVISGTGVFEKAGGAALVLTGDSSAFGGRTEISNGLLVVNGALGGAISMAEGGRLGGSGALGQLVVHEGGVAAPGNSIGTLNVAGDVTFEVGSTYEVEVDPAGTASDRIVVGGIADLKGGVVRHVGYPGDYRPSATYTILTAVGGVRGEFDDIETDFAFLDASLDYEANAVLMTLARNQVAFPDVGETFNQRSTGAAIEALGSGAVLFDAVIGQNAGGARQAFDALSGEGYASIRTAMSEDAGRMRHVLGDRLAAGDGAQGLQFWAQGGGGLTRLSGDDGAARLKHGAAGVVVGADIGSPTLRLGVAASSAAHDYSISSRATRADGTSQALAVYGGGRWGALSLNGGVSGAWHDIEAKRSVIFPGVAQALRANYDAATTQAFAEARWAVPLTVATIEPFASIARVRTQTDAFSESGGEAALNVRERTQAYAQATLGLGLKRTVDMGEGRQTDFRGRLGWRTAWGDTDADGRRAFADGPHDFSIRGTGIARDAVVAEVGVSADLSPRAAIAIDWKGQAGDGLNDQSLVARFNWSF